jgi:hypothetical protein
MVLLPCRVCACMQTQHKVELDERDKGGKAVPLPMAVSSYVPQAQTRRLDAEAGLALLTVAECTLLSVLQPRCGAGLCG